MLALQQQIGNRAVGALIARAPKPKAPAKPKVEMTSGPYAVIPKVGTIKLLSVQLGGAPLDRAAGRQGPLTDVMISSERGDHSDALLRLVLGSVGDIGPIELHFVRDGKPYMTIKLTGVSVTSYNVSGEGGGSGKAIESWSLQPEKIEYTTVTE